MDKLIAIEFNVSVTGEGADEKTFDILEEHDVEIVDHYMNGDLGEFECRTDSRETFYAVTDALDEAGIDSYVHE